MKKIAVITGASSGMGKRFAETVDRYGTFDEVWVIARHEAQLEALRKDLYERALANREKRTWAATTMDEVKELAKANTGYIKTMWCGDLACEMKMKEEAGLSSRCMPFEQEQLSDVCPCCGKPAKTMVYWGVAY